MKPGSIVTLILSAVLVVSGIIVCLVGVGMAKSSDAELFTQVSDDKTYSKQEFAANEITKIEFLVKDAEINISGNSDSSYIEYINYNPNFYSLTTTSRIISFDEIPDISSMLKFWENGFGFKGLRHIFNYKNFFMSGNNKVINLYISNNSALASIKIEADNADININDAYIKNGCSIDIKEGNIDMENFKADSHITVEANSSNVNMKGVHTKNFNFISTKSNVVSEKSAFENIDVNLSKGSVDIKNKNPSPAISYVMSSGTGTVFFDGENKGNIFMNAVSDVASEVKIKTESANINYEIIK